MPCLLVGGFIGLLSAPLNAQSGAQAKKHVASAESKPAPVRSLLGKELHPLDLPPASLERLQANLRHAREALEASPDAVENVIWVGRRLAYLWRYQDAVDMFTQGMVDFPDDPRLYRHRGHRWITLRQFDRAVSDLEKARQLMQASPDAIEPDGQPNAAGVPTSTLFTNVHYHLGLAYYLQSRFEHAAQEFQKCHDLADNNDMRVAALDWLFMSLSRDGKRDQAQELLAPITADMELHENFAYHRRLLMYKGLLRPEEVLELRPRETSTSDPQAGDSRSENRALDLATYGYGVGNWFLINGRQSDAERVFREVTDGVYWSAFGYIAAEADLARGLDRR